MFFYGLDGGVLNFKTNKATHNIMGNNKKYSRTLIYLLSVGISLFVLIPLGMYITPLVILLGGIWLFYVLLSIISLVLAFLFKLLLERSNVKNEDFLIFPIILSSIALPYFGFLKIMEALLNSVTAKIVTPTFFKNMFMFPQNLPNTDLAHSIFNIFQFLFFMQIHEAF